MLVYLCVWGGKVTMEIKGLQHILHDIAEQALD